MMLQKGLQKCIPLGKGFFVGDEGVQVVGIELGDEGIEPRAPFRTPA